MDALAACFHQQALKGSCIVADENTNNGGFCYYKQESQLASKYKRILQFIEGKEAEMLTACIL
ncbi:hypothetical protein DP923_12120 [Pontibacter arcticus]|uniref:Uncharacterized protein n=1 Tax=Pontibacter arcticus TaxID=2080288 RepID=A0A364RE11_9BACT|nr:hypothetical protein DP923_12120 [Pontibacter arcticus]